MTEPQRQFFLIFYTKLLALLKDKEHLLKAQADFEQNDQNPQRYACLSLGLGKWTNVDARLFSAAVAEALRETTLAFYADNEETLQFNQSCIDLLKNRRIPKLIAQVDPSNPFEEAEQKINQELHQLSQKDSFFNNRYALFGGMAAAAVITAITVKMIRPEF
ncbi:hypothetical protein A8135_12575 [Legionella jamestowniensis]|uniref:Uncharacterized protein n=1 Tax=Legionella jamestowniensis TaxID=455 RepID=A0ABX2XUU5_9GAMM|nr:hypothetical protein [Legionella jamestowniensis]OCH98379.1 hypothetical protein A8135_12575 [Legionella jamestowniensis]